MKNADPVCGFEGFDFQLVLESENLVVQFFIGTLY